MNSRNIQPENNVFPAQVSGMYMGIAMTLKSFLTDDTPTVDLRANEDTINETNNPRGINMRSVSQYEMDAKLETIETKLDARVSRIEGIAQDIKSETSSARKEFRGIALAIVLAIVGAVWAMWQINSSLISGTIAAFESGKNMSAAQTDIKRQIEETDKRLSAIDDRLKIIDNQISPNKK